jgi:hypothetical protein
MVPKWFEYYEARDGQNPQGHQRRYPLNFYVPRKFDAFQDFIIFPKTAAAEIPAALYRVDGRGTSKDPVLVT